MMMVVISKKTVTVLICRRATAMVAISKKTVTVLILGTTLVFIQHSDDGCNLQEDGDGIDVWKDDYGIYSG
jgi:hypothetical protein